MHKYRGTVSPSQRSLDPAGVGGGFAGRVAGRPGACDVRAYVRCVAQGGALAVLSRNLGPIIPLKKLI